VCLDSVAVSSSRWHEHSISIYFEEEGGQNGNSQWDSDLQYVVWWI
jgi:hypothetical protein